VARSVRANVIANYVGAGWSALMGLAFVPVYIHYLGIESYALIGVFGVLQAWLSLLDFGMAPTLNREMSRLQGGAHTPQSIRDLLRSVEVLYLGVAVIIVGAVWGGAGWLAEHWLNAQALPLATVAQALSITGVVIAFRWIGGLYRSAIVGLQEHVALNVVNVTFATLRGAGVIGVLALVSPTITAFFIFQAFLAAVEALVLFLLVYRFIPGAPAPARFQLAALRRIARFAAGITLVTLLSLLLTQTDKIILAGFLPLRDFGYYALAGTAALAIATVAGPVATAVGPKLTQLVAGGSSAELADAYHRYAQLLALAVLPTGAIVVFFPDYLLLLWTRDETTTAAVAPILGALAVGATFNSLMYVPYMLQLAYGWTRFAVMVNLVAVAILTPALFVIAPIWGAMGAAALWAVLNVAYILVALPLMHRRLLRGEHVSWYLVDVGPPLLLVVSAAFALRALGGNPVSEHAAVNAVFVFAAGLILVLSAALSSPFGREVLLRLSRRAIRAIGIPLQGK
jgi:O-antigen/teichoic acid export membrane protein